MENEPKTIIVNEDDVVINHKSHEDVKKEDIYRVSALWIKNSKGEFLLAQRGLNKTHDPGQWGPAVAGTNDEGETYESNIIKETEEEIGLKEIKLTKGGKNRRGSGRKDHNYFCQWFVATVDKDLDEFIIQENEVEQIKWFTKKELEDVVKLKIKNYFSQLEYCLNKL